MTKGDSEVLVSLSMGELHALADGLIAPSAQACLDQLIARNSENGLSPDESQELDRLLELADQLTLLETRARYTLSQLKLETAGS